MLFFKPGRSFCVLLILSVCCISAAPVSSGAAELTPQHSPASPSEAERILSARDALFLAKALVDKGRVDDAEKIYLITHNFQLKSAVYKA